MTQRVHTLSTFVVFLVLVASVYLWGKSALKLPSPSAQLAVVANPITPPFVGAPVAPPAPAAPEPAPRVLADRPEINARAFISVRVNGSGLWQVLASAGASEPHPIASLTKLMTAIVASDRYTPSQVVTIINPAPSVIAGDAGSETPTPPAEPELFKLEEALRLLLIPSSNAAAIGLAEPLGETNFVNQMNDTARRFGLNQTRFSNPSGLDPTGDGLPSYSSAEDLVRLAWIMVEEYPSLLSITRLLHSEIVAIGNTETHQLQNTNRLLTTAVWPAEVVGGKTGQTVLAKKNLLLVLRDRRSGDYLVNVVLGADDHFTAMGELVDWAYQSGKI